MVEELRRQLRETIHEDPIRPVAQQYEDKVGVTSPLDSSHLTTHLSSPLRLAS